MTTATPLYGTPTAMTITLASLATSAVDVGRQSSAVDQKDTVDAIDCILGGKIMVSTAAVTANTQIEVWLYSSWDDVEYNSGATGTDGAQTATNVKTAMALFGIIPVPVTTAATQYYLKTGSVAQAFGGVIPVSWGVFVTQNTGQNLHSVSSNHEIYYTPVKYESS